MYYWEFCLDKKTNLKPLQDSTKPMAPGYGRRMEMFDITCYWSIRRYTLSPAAHVPIIGGHVGGPTLPLMTVASTVSPTPTH